MTASQPDEPEELPAPPDSSDPLATAQYLGASLRQMSKRLRDAQEASEARDEALAAAERKNRHRIWLSFVLVAVDIALTVLVFRFAAEVNQTRQASATSCASGNDTRQTLTQVFDHIFGSFGPATGTPAQKAAAVKKLEGIETYYHGKFAPRDCAAIYGVTPAATTAPTTGKSG